MKQLITNGRLLKYHHFNKSIPNGRRSSMIPHNEHMKAQIACTHGEKSKWSSQLGIIGLWF
jgi:hypothetical protein